MSDKKIPSGTTHVHHAHKAAAQPAKAPESVAVPTPERVRPMGEPKSHMQTVAAMAEKGKQLGRDSAQFGNASVAKTDAVKSAGKTGGQYLMCPVMGSLIAEGSLHKDANGNINLKELNDVMVNRLGITPERAAVTVGTGVLGNHASDFFKVAGGKLNLDHLQGSILDHQGEGDTGILHGGTFHEDRFQALISHSSDGKTLSVQDFSEAISSQLAHDKPGVNLAKGTSEDIFEMSALINTLGKVDAKGVRRIDISTLRDLYQNRKLPPKAELMGRPATGVIDHGNTMAKMTGDLAQTKAREVAGGSKAKPKGICPYMSSMAPPPPKVPTAN